MTAVIGIDFGTTNSVVSVLGPGGAIATARIPAGGEMLDVFRSVLCFWTDEVRAGGKLRHAAGPDAIEAYLDDPLDSRLIMSMKTYLAQRSFTETRIFGRPFTLERLVALFLRELLAKAGATPHGARIVAGRPVRFAGEFADDALGEARLRAAYAEAALPGIDVALEPEAAGYRFARTLTRAATVLIGDFGGGTSDFSLLRFEPGDDGGVTALGHAGIGIAGDTFDYRIIDRVISPRLGKGDVYTVMGKELPVPPEYFSTFARWHRMSLMRTPRTLREIGEVARASAHPERLRALITLIEDELGYRLYQTVSAAKAALSTQDAAVLRFRHKNLDIERTVTRAEFEDWIAEDLSRLAATVDRALGESRVDAQAVDHVFLTGGTSFVPAVRRLFDDRFGRDKVTAGGEFVSVAEGLALIGRDRALRAAA
ncbi:Hsp70 family protein [Limobrevibacterium gyesilva]|uniref:Hsp70 family protein n=1 Tax=Limobrevibacterium gyesilva TaxID=2991712 RepID=A0AA41YIF3_9PROT|nr:Hsp70 family protein [Limobrevibacterium gyesilva]MCW3474126.1 Hsp70 family protein [Limobrevibacterium gyesilva]